ncbi:dioxygenase family protein [Polaribacter gochangensis]|uniref:dioxygenase family protein n=1 Tax=Polaribacter gochangensis TaxID=3252903 RepID=UPI003904CC4E
MCSQSTKKYNANLKTGISSKNTNQKDCNWCGAFEAPEDVSWRTIIPPKEEQGDKLIISGTIYLPDGKTPVKDVIIYVYHTNTKGVYPKKGNEKENGKHHGYLRGWMKTNSNGRYEFETIRPAPYRTHDGEPAHIHYNIEAPDYPEYWLTGLWFADDYRVNEYKDKIERNGGFSNIITLTKDENNILRGTRNIILKKFND